MAWHYSRFSEISDGLGVVAQCIVIAFMVVLGIVVLDFIMQFACILLTVFERLFSRVMP